MNIVMNMSSYEIEGCNSIESGDDTGALRSDLNRNLGLTCQQYEYSQTNRHITMPLSLANIDVDVFLQKMHASQRK